MTDFVVGKKYRNLYGGGSTLVECYALSPDEEMAILKVVECDSDEPEWKVNSLFEATNNCSSSGWKEFKESVTITNYVGVWYDDISENYRFTSATFESEERLKRVYSNNPPALVAIIPVTYTSENGA